jgi:hypothetical protein
MSCLNRVLCRPTFPGYFLYAEMGDRNCACKHHASFSSALIFEEVNACTYTQIAAGKEHITSI